MPTAAFPQQWLFLAIRELFKIKQLWFHFEIIFDDNYWLSYPVCPTALRFPLSRFCQYDQYNDRQIQWRVEIWAIINFVKDERITVHCLIEQKRKTVRWKQGINMLLRHDCKRGVCRCWAILSYWKHVSYITLPIFMFVSPTAHPYLVEAQTILHLQSVSTRSWWQNIWISIQLVLWRRHPNHWLHLA